MKSLISLALGPLILSTLAAPGIGRNPSSQDVAQEPDRLEHLRDEFERLDLTKEELPVRLLATLPTLIRSSEAEQVAAGAYLAGKYQQRNCIPALIDALGIGVPAKEHWKDTDQRRPTNPRRSILDALVRMEVFVPARLLRGELEAGILEPVVILLSKRPVFSPSPSHLKIESLVRGLGLQAAVHQWELVERDQALLEILEFRGPWDDTPFQTNTEAFWAAASILVSRQSQGVASRLLADLEIQLGVDVCGPGWSYSLNRFPYSRGMVSAIGASCPVWPPSVSYSFGLDGAETQRLNYQSLDGAGGKEYQWERSESLDIGACKTLRTLEVMPSTATSRALEGLVRLSGRKAEPLLWNESMAVDWAGPDDLTLRVELAAENLHKRFEVQLFELLNRGLLTPAEYARIAASLTVRIDVEDCRDQADGVPLPEFDKVFER